MSLPRKETIECPKCRSTKEMSVWSSVNVTTDPDLKPKLLDGSLLRFQCRCGYSCKIECDFLYHDMNKRLAVWLKYPDEDGLFDIKPAAANLGNIFGETYVRRVVPTYEELIETIKSLTLDSTILSLRLLNFSYASGSRSISKRPLRSAGSTHRRQV